MNYIVYFDVAALAVYVFILVYFWLEKGIYKLQNKIFMAMAVNGLVSSILDISSSILINRAAEVENTFFLYATNYAFLIVHNLQSYLYFFYIISVVGFKISEKSKSIIILTIPMVVEWILFILNPFTNAIFYFDENMIYRHGIGAYYLYGCAFFYLVIAVCGVLVNKDIISKKKTTVLIGFIFGAFAVVFVQMFFQNLLLELFVQSLLLTAILLTIEDESEIINADTGLYNRNAFITDSYTSFARNHEYSLVTIKFWNFELFNMAFGIDEVKAAYTSIAEWLRTEFSAYNIYECNKAKIVISIPDSREEVVNNIIDIISDRFQIAWWGIKEKIDFRIQICEIKVPFNANSVEKLMSIIDSNEGHASENDKVSIIRNESVVYMYHDLEIRQAIRRSLDNGGFKVFFQPIWDAKTNKIHSAEALVRLFDEELGQVYPDDFIPVAEKDGTINEIGEFVFEEACRFFKQENIKQLGIEFIEVNLSTIQCMHMELTDSFRHILRKYDVNPADINLEITESAAIKNPELFMGNIRRLQEMGFTISMDDYGTGYSNYSTIYGLDFNIIKLDKSILWNAEKTETAKIILESTVDMLKKLGKKIVMEGVETEMQRDYLLNLGVDYCQGVLWSRPIKETDFLEFVYEYNKAE